MTLSLPSPSCLLKLPNDDSTSRQNESAQVFFRVRHTFGGMQGKGESKGGMSDYRDFKGGMQDENARATSG